MRLTVCPAGEGRLQRRSSLMALEPCGGCSMAGKRHHIAVLGYRVGIVEHA